ncbi:sugar ABC transporter permease [Intrasporangium chromatireducens Q5-1]|uniref:Sugar ABC transporter permease n=1 Tax=Intrasporangium chromatireducens Q5-1 TaxID=584657 RepID=W9GH98_9MICO|nr:sugar ABC transporter permease [Intrasporangium chromatireducens]EWT05596.1 sugar ABC transporter permease [Intrasporangium chromatireducens Q5-1]
MAIATHERLEVANQIQVVGHKRRTGTWWKYALAGVALVWALFPIVFIVSAAMNPSGTLSTTSLVPNNAGLDNFTELFSLRPYGSWYKNTLIVCGVGAFASVFIGASAAYVFSRMRFRGRRVSLMILLLAQMFPVMLAFVAIYLTFFTIGEALPGIGLNTQAGLILAYLGGAMGANVWLLKGYFDTVPRELDEAAKVDGASHARIFFTMTLRLVMPILVTVGMLSFVGLFSEFLLASIFLKDADNQTLAVGLWSLLKADKNKYFGPFCAGALLASLPVMGLYFGVQRWLVSGLTQGSVK